MPIGAVVGGAVIGAGGSIAASAMSSSATRRAANTAADSSAATTAANNALIRETRNQNIALATPFYNGGVSAGNALSDLLLGTNTFNQSQVGSSGGALASYQNGPGQWGAYLTANPDVAAEARRVVANGEFDSPADYAQWHYQRYGQAEGRELPSAGSGALQIGDTQGFQNADTVSPAGVLTAGGGNTTTGGGALDAFDRFRAGTNYQFRFNEGMKGINSGFAARGALDSGAAEKSRITFGQNIASGELSNYMNLLAQQQNVGLTAANAVMGVSTNAANAIAGQNTNAGNVAANAALANGQASANMWGTVGNTAGQLGGALFQYGMGQMQRPQVPTPQAINVTPTSQSNYWNSRGFG